MGTGTTRLVGKRCRGNPGTRARKEVIATVSKSSRSKVTSKSVASKASKTLADGRSAARTKSIAGSALSQAKGKRK